MLSSAWCLVCFLEELTGKKVLICRGQQREDVLMVSESKILPRLARKGSTLHPGVLLGELVRELGPKRQKELDPAGPGQGAWTLSCGQREGVEGGAS